MQQSVEQSFVAILQCTQIDVLVETLAARDELAPTVFDLLIERFLRGRQQSEQSELETFRRE